MRCVLALTLSLAMACAKTSPSLPRREASPTAPSPASTAAATVAWGPASPEGLQLGCWAAPPNVIACAVRNVGPRPVRYSAYFLGNPSYIRVSDSALQAGSALSAGASESDVHELAPGERMPPSPRQPAAAGATFSFAWSPPAAARYPFSLSVAQDLGGDGSSGTFRGTLTSGAVSLAGNGLGRTRE
ncbi:MAG: hypothetical protein HOO96_18400 [Polyangiaceae bacterium]|nr:hypothetical protein [Polyangiaceae bacterium]